MFLCLPLCLSVAMALQASYLSLRWPLLQCRGVTRPGAAYFAEGGCARSGARAPADAHAAADRRACRGAHARALRLRQAHTLQVHACTSPHEPPLALAALSLAAICAAALLCEAPHHSHHMWRVWRESRPTVHTVGCSQSCASVCCSRLPAHRWAFKEGPDALIACA